MSALGVERANKARIRRAAVHEAGHIVCAMDLGLPFVEAQVDRRGSGNTRFYEELLPATWATPPYPSFCNIKPDRPAVAEDQVRLMLERERVKSFIVCALAGGLAVVLCIGRAYWVESLNDSARAHNAARHLTGTDTRAKQLLGRLRTRARETLRGNQLEVEAVADALIARATLSSDDVERILEQATRERGGFVPG